MGTGDSASKALSGSGCQAPVPSLLTANSFPCFSGWGISDLPPPQTIWCAWPKGHVATTGCCCCSSTCSGTTAAFREIRLILFIFWAFAVDRTPCRYPLSRCSRQMFGVLSPGSSSISVSAPSLATAQRSAAHPLHWVTLHKWCWREILTASGKQICSFGKGNSSWHFHFPLPDKLPQAPWLILHPVPASWLSPDHPYFHTDQSHIALKDKRFAASLALSSF